MRKILIATAAATLLASTAFSSFAQTTPRIDQREENQQKRVDQGVKSGTLTNQEATRLEKGQEHVQNLEDKAKVDGKVTAKERARVEHAQDQQSRHIYKEKHDRQHDLNHDGKMDRLRNHK